MKIEQTAGAAGLPHIKLTVVPGPRVRVQSVALDSTAPLAPRTPTREEPWTDRLDKLRQTWRAQARPAFRQADWSGAKNATLAELRADGYPTATWQSTRARIDASERTAALDRRRWIPARCSASAPIRIDGIHRYDEVAVRQPGDLPPRRRLQRASCCSTTRSGCIKVGLFEGASVELDATGPPEAAPVIVKVKEQSQHQATFGIGYSANTGGRASRSSTGTARCSASPGSRTPR